ncbi:DUF6477 family protein [Tropicibacter naphthalenivorans]|uniref:Uncharacterized protein n=1 Tax=Tropicibacter naphthalenivorans TaxID=441103 RepID=A0A0P1G543_9RHOB|nr:DUF6477 family protein [Tropicibacter naphthalenivorans]CUH76909.1 hypothetical protein TRN7648_01187 [Tropicibacter naphthalenivorans]SMC62351.1 hypothetical protein SAMN04488093_102431 [Tropicibacter naphthalenivorans]
MKDVLGMLNDLRRPRLLIRAARIAAQDYQRAKHLGPLLGGGGLPRSGAAIVKLMELEADIDTRRRTHDAGYSVSAHVEILTALMGEAKVLREARYG